MNSTETPIPTVRRDLACPTDWFTVEQIDPLTFAFSEYGQWMKLHSYLLIGKERAALIDTGLGVDNILRHVGQLTSLPVTVISTHAHWDHIGNHSLFDDILIHPAEKEWLSEGYGKEAASIREYLVDRPFMKTPPATFDLQCYGPPPCQATGFIHDQQTIDLGERTLQLFHTPGHSPGHVCIHDLSTGYLATGDLIYQGTLLAGLTDSDPRAFLDSVVRMNTLPNLTRLLPGHGRIDLSVDFLDHAKTAFRQLDERGQLQFGTGMHAFKRLIISL